MENPKDEIALAFDEMQANLKKVSEEHSERTWLQNGKTFLNEKMRGDKTLAEMSKEVVDFLASYLDAPIGTLYVYENGVFQLQYSHGVAKKAFSSFGLGEGLAGQAAAEKVIKTFNKIPKGYFKIESSLGGEKPDSVVVIPAILDNRTIGVIELARFGVFTPLQSRFLMETVESIAASLSAALDKQSLKQLLEEIQSQKTDMEKTSLELSQQISCLNHAAIVSIADANGDIIYVNDTFCKISKYSREELIGQNHRILKSGKQQDGLFVGMWKAISTGRVWSGELLNKAKDGSLYWVDTTITPFKGIDGKVEKYVAIRFDITATKNQKDEIEAITNAIYKSNCAVEFDMEGKILKANQIFLDLFGYREKEILGKQHRMFVEKEYQSSEDYKRFWETLRMGEYCEGEFKRVGKNGNLIWIKGTYNPILDMEGRPYKVLKIAVDMTFARQQTEELASQAEELQAQQEELRQLNEELEEQAMNLKQQQEELQMTNEELEEQTQSLEASNKEIEEAKNDIERKTEQLEISSRYKSEFLANMSHELRTPLNSLLILSKDLAENKKQNLFPDQTESAEIIYKSGHDLLVLINEVLDLSKIEAGKMVITVEKVWLKELMNNLSRDFKHLAENKGLDLNMKIGEDVPEFIRTDSLRLNQVLKNLLSNAIKFTEKGSVSVQIIKKSGDKIAIAISDTGIGVPEDKRMAIFEAFQQADGGTSRKYGGTGLGLSISRELAKLLEGEIKLESAENSGSTFTLIIPTEIKAPLDSEKEPIIVKSNVSSFRTASKEMKEKFLNYPAAKDDKDQIQNGDKIVLIIEDDLKFADILIQQARKKGFKALSAATGESGLVLASKHTPDAIILDLDLPGMNGHMVLSELKSDASVRHIPVHIISANERSLRPVKEGAVEYLTKPIEKKQLESTFKRIENFVSRKMKNLLIIEDDENSRKAMRKLIGNGDVKCLEAETGKEALKIYREEDVDCIILDIGLSDISGFELIHKLEKEKGGKVPPIIVYTGRELTKEENKELEKYAESIIIKGIKSEERLLDETALFLHRTVNNLPESQQRMIAMLYDKESAFKNKKILLVDDDMRNIFALSKILMDRGLEVIKAENGRMAVESLNEHPDIQLVLMDIMMPEMDGYQAMQKIRQQDKYKKLPIIALTAKAMKDDRQKCIDAGANDYISKPVDTDRLLTLMRVWMGK